MRCCSHVVDSPNLILTFLDLPGDPTVSKTLVVDLGFLIVSYGPYGSQIGPLVLSSFYLLVHIYILYRDHLSPPVFSC